MNFDNFNEINNEVVTSALQANETVEGSNQNPELKDKSKFRTAKKIILDEDPIIIEEDEPYVDDDNLLDDFSLTNQTSSNTESTTQVQSNPEQTVQTGNITF